MNIKNLFMLLIALTFVFALVSCGGCDPHVDENGDSICDNCDEYFTVQVNFTVKLENGQPFSASNLVLERGGKTITVSLDANGKGTADLPIGLYYVSFEGAYVADAYGIKVDGKNTEYTLTVLDNTPDGTANKPFFVSEVENQVTLAPGQTIFYTCHASSAKFVRVYNEYVAIGYNGETYLHNDGCVEVALKVVDGGENVFSITNLSHSELNVVFYLESPLGASDNPIILSENTISATVTVEGITYYSWTAYKNGVLTVENLAEGIEISFTKIIEGDVPVKSEIDENGNVYMDVLAGEIIKIEVSVASASESNPVNIQASLIIND